jgi:MFS family permease
MKNGYSNTDGLSTRTTAVLLLVSTLTIMAGATISPALPEIETHFSDVPQSKLIVGLLLTIPAAAIALTAPVAGWLSDRMRKKRLLASAILVYAAAGTSGLWLDGLTALLVGRILLGIAVAVIMVTATALIADLYVGEARARLVGWQAAATSFGGVVFLLAGGALAELGWRGPFAVYGVALLLAPLALLWLPETGSGERGSDGTKIKSIEQATIKRTLGVAIIAALAGAAFYLVPTRLPFRLVELGIVGGLWSGGAIGAMVFASGIASLAAKHVAVWSGRAPLVGSAIVLLGAGLAGTGVMLTYPALLLALVTVGVGTGLLQPTLMAMALDTAPEHARGRVAGLMASAMFGGQFASPFISAPIEDSFDLATAFRLIGSIIAAGGTLYLITAIAILRRSTSLPEIAS